MFTQFPCNTCVFGLSCAGSYLCVFGFVLFCLLVCLFVFLFSVFFFSFSVCLICTVPNGPTPFHPFCIIYSVYIGASCLMSHFHRISP